MTDTKIASDDRTVTDPNTGVERKVFAGTEIPPDLLDAYEQAGGASTDRPPTAPGEVIASSTMTVTDPATGVERRLLEGQPVPPDLVDAYSDATGDREDPDSGESGAQPARRSRSRPASKTDSGD